MVFFMYHYYILVSKANDEFVKFIYTDIIIRYKK